MSTSMFYYTELVKDYRKVFNQIKPEYYYSVIFRKGGRQYKILRLSIFDPLLDDENNFLKVTSREFKDNTAFYLNFVRYTLSNLIVTVNGKPKWVVEPRLGLVKYMLNNLNIVSRNDLKNLLLNGHLPALLGGNPEELRREATELQKKYKSISDEKSMAQSEKARLQDKIGVLSRQLEELRKKYREVCNPQLH
ncbi:hypothetical protein ACWJKU_17440 [Methylocaldum sp. MU1018]